ncbi:cellulase family glycosylhydrolase, partial [Candidatus Gottesmanbacteria bacterium]|nr:cellulase family glycosylhydrolase [Candidatus Gottesmanbacteria bacterium]
MKIKRVRLVFNFKIYVYGIFLVAIFIAILYFRNTTFRPNIIQGWLHTKGTKIFDSQNKEIVIRGINYYELTPINFVYLQPDLTDLPDVCKLWNRAPSKLNAKKVSNMGFNAVRLVLNWDTLEPSAPIIDKDGNLKHNWNMDYVLAIDQIVSDLKKEKIAVILDMHQYLWSSAFKYIDSEDGKGCSGGGIPAWLYPDVTNLTFQQARCDFFKNIKY